MNQTISKRWEQNSDIVLKSRATGNTSYIIRAVINDPNVIIVCKNEMVARDMEKRYRDAIRNLSWERMKEAIYLIGIANTEPRFVGPDFRYDGLHGIPVIFDNSALI